MSKINSWYKIIFGLPQVSILGLLLFVFLIDLLFIFEDSDFASHANDKTPSVNASNIDKVAKSLEETL